jgi:hypothetical protein
MAIDLNQVTVAYPGFRTQWGIEQYLFGAQGNDLSHSRKSDKIDGSGFGTRVKNDLPGMQEAAITVKGLAAMEKGAINSLINQWLGRKTPVNTWYALQGLTVGSPITMQPSSVTDGSVSAKLKDANDFNLELSARGAYDDGIIMLSPGTLLTAASGTGAVDINTLYGGATTGCTVAAQLHVWALDGGTTPSVAVKIQHSPDGTTWTDLITFTTKSAPGSQRITLPSTTTVNTQVQAVWTLTGSPTGVQVLCGFSRGVNLDV